MSQVDYRCPNLKGRAQSHDDVIRLKNHSCPWTLHPAKDLWMKDSERKLYSTTSIRNMDSSRSRPCPHSSSSPHHHSDSFLLCFTLLHGQVAEQLAYYVHVSETVIAEETFDAAVEFNTVRGDPTRSGRR
ncbi:hypothetical protein PAMP_015566 [Pampus punctatissimus]